MSFAGTAVAVGASVAGSVASGAMASGAAGQSAKDVKNAAFKGEMKTYENLVDATKNLTPWIGSGVAAQGLVDIGLGLNGVSDADIRKAEEDVRTWQTKLEEIKALKVKKKNIDEKYARIAQYNKSLEDAQNRLAGLQKARQAQDSGVVRPGEFSENLWRDFTLADLADDAGYQYLKREGLIGEGGIQNDPRMKWLADRGLISLDGKWETDPGYLFRLSEGQKVLENSAAARGGLLSGQTGKALQQYGQNFASNEFGNIYDRYTRLWDDYANRSNQAFQGAYGRHVADYMARAGEREAKFGKLTGQSGQGLQTLGQLAQLAFQGQQANNQGTANAVNAAGNYNVMGANAMASGLSSALNSIGSLAMYAGGGGFGGGGGSSGGGGGSGGGVNTGTFANNLANNTAFQNFMPKNYWG
jgi:hypothetical protein